MILLAEEFYDAWWFLHEHPKFCHLKDGVPDVLPGFFDALTVEVVKVNPETETIESDRDRNTATRVWLEAGPWSLLPSDVDPGPRGTYDEISSHDPRLDCGGPTYERAIRRMALLVLEHYGDYEKE